MQIAILPQNCAVCQPQRPQMVVHSYKYIVLFFQIFPQLRNMIAAVEKIWIKRAEMLCHKSVIC